MDLFGKSMSTDYRWLATGDWEQIHNLSAEEGVYLFSVASGAIWLRYFFKHH